MSITKVTDAGLDRSRIVTPIIINGDMSVSQRTTSESSVNSVKYSACDRWYTNPQNIGTYTISQSTEVPTGQGFGKSYKVDCTTADASPSANDIFQIQQRIEGQNLQLIKKGTSNAEATTLSFWVKSNLTATFGVTLQDNDNSRIIGSTFAISSANTWEKKVISLDGDTTGALDNDNANSLQLQFCLGTGSTYTGADNTSWGASANGKLGYGVTGNIASSTSNEFYLTGVPMEVGEFDANTIPTFPFESFDNNLRKCQRYYQKIAEGNGKRWDLVSSARTTSYVDFVFPCTVVMRAQPTLDAVSGTEYYMVYSSNGGYDKFSVPVINSNYNEGSMLVTGYYSGGSYTAGDSLHASTDNSSAYLALNAEL